MINTNVRIVCLFITVVLIITVLHKLLFMHKSKLSYSKHAKKASKIKAIETGIILDVASASRPRRLSIE